MSLVSSSLPRSAFATCTAFGLGTCMCMGLHRCRFVGWDVLDGAHAKSKKQVGKPCIPLRSWYEDTPHPAPPLLQGRTILVHGLRFVGGWISTCTRHVVVPRFHRPRSFLSSFLSFFLSPLGCLLLLLAIHASYPTQSLATCGADVGRSGQTRNEDGVGTSQRRRTTRTMDVHLGPSLLSHPHVLHLRLQHEPRRVRHATRSHASLSWNSVVRRTHTRRASPTTTYVGRADPKPPPSSRTTSPWRRSTTSTHVRGDAAIEQDSSLALARRETKRSSKEAVESTTTTDESYARRRPTTRACRTPRRSSWLHRRRKKHGRSHEHACRRPRAWK